MSSEVDECCSSQASTDDESDLTLEDTLSPPDDDYDVEKGGSSYAEEAEERFAKTDKDDEDVEVPHRAVLSTRDKAVEEAPDEEGPAVDQSEDTTKSTEEDDDLNSLKTQPREQKDSAIDLEIDKAVPIDAEKKLEYEKAIEDEPADAGIDAEITKGIESDMRLEIQKAPDAEQEDVEIDKAMEADKALDIEKGIEAEQEDAEIDSEIEKATEAETELQTN